VKVQLGGRIMRAVAGAIVVLAGAVMGGAGAVAEAIPAASNRSGHGSGVWFVFVAGGALVGMVGIGLLVKALNEERPPR
jgi:hypothetical protein